MRKKAMPKPGLIALTRVVALSDDLIDEYIEDTGREHGSLSYAARRMGLNVTVLSSMRQGTYNAMGLRTITQVARATGCTIGALTDPEDD